MTTESAGDRDSAAKAIFDHLKYRLTTWESEDPAVKDCYRDDADAAISALRARGLSREAVELDRRQLQVEKTFSDVAKLQVLSLNAEIASLRAALEGILTLDEEGASHRYYVMLRIAREALNAGAKP